MGSMLMKKRAMLMAKPRLLFDKTSHHHAATIGGKYLSLNMMQRSIAVLLLNIHRSHTVRKTMAMATMSIYMHKVLHK
jgi:hypothetical protein